ncbi:MAG: DMT family transporter [Gemmatimonadaceae bacterium]|nr:DMT family transporter [Gemmatimonadaceae bacterium]
MSAPSESAPHPAATAALATDTAPRGGAGVSASLAAAVACICFGASVVATRHVVPQTTPIVLAFLRYVIGSLCMFAVLRRRALAPMAQRDRVQVLALGALFFGLFPWSFSASLTHLPAATVALILATIPLVTMALSVLRGTERPSVGLVSGQLLALFGIVLAISPALRSAGDEVARDATQAGSWTGYVLAFTTVCCGAVYNVWSRPLLLRYPSATITSWAMVAGAMSLAPLALLQGLAANTRGITPDGWLTVLFLGTLGGAVGFGLWSYALRRSTPSRVAVFLALNPISAIALGVLLLGEPVSLRLFVALAAVLAGIQLATRGTRQAKTGSAPAASR